MTTTRRAAIILGWLAAALLCASVVVFRTPIVNDIGEVLPGEGEAAELFAELQASVGARLTPIGIEGGDEQVRADASRRLAARLRETGRFARVANGTERPGEAEQRMLFMNRYLLSPTVVPERFTEAGLRGALEQRLAELRSPASTLQEKAIPADPTGEFLPLVRSWMAGRRQPAIRAGVWVSPDGARALLLAESPPDLEPRDREALVPLIESAFAEIAAGTDLRLILGGPTVMAAISERIVREEASLLGFASITCIALVLAFGFRSMRVVLLTPMVPVSAVLAGVAAVGLIFGGMHGIALGFGATVMGVAVDYPVHLLSHRRPGEPPQVTAARIWPTVRLCVATTALGYVAMVSRDLPILAQLATFAVAGLLTAAVITRVALPNLLAPTWAPPQPPAVWARLSRPLLARPVATGLVVLATASALLTFVVSPEWENDIAALNPVPRAVRADDAALRAALGAPDAGHLVFVRADSAETALQKSEAVAVRLRALVGEGALAGVDAPSDILPSLATQARRQAALPPRADLEASLGRAQEGLPFRPGVFAPFLDQVEAARSARLLTPDSLRGTALGLRLSALLLARGDRWTALLPISGLRDRARVDAALAETNDPDVRRLDLRAETNRLIAQFRDATMWRLAAGAALLYLVLAVGLRSPARAAVVALPVTIAVVVDLLALSLLGQKLTLFHLVSLLLVVGISIDYALFFACSDPDPGEKLRTVRSLVLCCATTLAGFGVLTMSSLPVLEAIGWTVAVGVLAGLAASLLFSRPDLPRAERVRKTAAEETVVT